MGGKNACVVLDDAALRQAVHEVAVSGYLIGGTALHRQRARARPSQDRGSVHRCAREGRAVVEGRQPGGCRGRSRGRSRPRAALAKVDKAIAAAKAGGAEAIVAGEKLAGGSYRTPSLHRLPDGVHDVAGLHRCRDLRTGSVRRGHRFRRGGARDLEREPVRVRPRGVHGVAVRAVLSRDQDRHVEQQPLDEPREREAAVRRRRQERQLSTGRCVGASQRRASGRDPREPARSGDAARAARGASAGCTTSIGSSRSTRPRSCRSGARSLIDMPRPMQMLRPAGGRLPKSEALLARLYAGDRVPKEKKPPVFDHLRSAGPWMVSIDDEPLCVLDGMSQTATVVGGFAEDPVVRGVHRGRVRGLDRRRTTTPRSARPGPRPTTRTRCASWCRDCRT